jgi:hypothetical protein
MGADHVEALGGEPSRPAHALKAFGPVEADFACLDGVFGEGGGVLHGDPVVGRRTKALVATNDRPFNRQRGRRRGIRPLFTPQNPPFAAAAVNQAPRKVYEIVGPMIEL